MMDTPVMSSSGDTNTTETDNSQINVVGPIFIEDDSEDLVFQNYSSKKYKSHHCIPEQVASAFDQ